MTRPQDLRDSGPGGRSAGDGRRWRVVVGVDGSAGSRAALAFALTTAAARDAELEVVSTYVVIPYWTTLYTWDPTAVGHPTAAETVRAQTEERVAAFLEEVRQDPAVSAVPGAADVAVRTVLTAGPAAGELLSRSRDADLLVVGSRGRGGFRSAVLGSVALHCATHAECPVVVVRPMASVPVEPARVVVGIDGSERSRAALVRAVVEAAQRGGQVEAVAAYELADHWTAMCSALSPAAAQIRAELEERASAFVRDALDAWEPEAGGGQPSVRVQVVEGPAHDVLVSRARGATMLVVGGTGRSELGGLLLGSVALHCAMHAPCPVLVVHPGARRPRAEEQRSQPAATVG
ncbi:universal stress protein [Geodermatophilus sp. SYSU D01176]